MANISVLDDSTVQNLKDAGCADELIETFAFFNGEENIHERLNLLSKHRASLLNKIHENQKRLDCLDYLILKIKKQPKILSGGNKT